MESNPLLPLPEGMHIDQIQASENEVSITVIATYPTCCCPLCSEPSCSIHSHYRRRVRDVPCGGRRVQLILCVRKFFEAQEKRGYPFKPRMRVDYSLGLVRAVSQSLSQPG